MKFLVLSLFLANICFSQNFKQFIPISTFVSDEGTKDYPDSRSMLENFLTNIVSSSGLGAVDNSRFYITPKLAVVSKKVLSGPPAKILTTVNLSLFIADNSTGKVFSSYNVNLTGAGTNDFSAISDVLNQLDPSDPKIQKFIEEGRNRITDYYSNSCEQIIASAKSKSTEDIYFSIFELNLIPESNKDCFLKAQKVSKELYDIHVQNTCSNDVAKAKVIWSSGLNQKSADEAMAYISNTYLTSSCQQELNTLVNDINLKLSIDKANKIKLLELDKQNEMRRQELVGKAMIEYFKNQPKPVYNTNLILIR